MQFDIYCDESRPDLFFSKNPANKYLLIGSLWLRAEDRTEFKKEIHLLRDIHKIGGESKWTKVSPSRQDYYLALVDWFCDKGDSLRFRCIAVPHNNVDFVKFHDGDPELAFYKFYYQLLQPWLLDFNEYCVFCDFKMNREQTRLSRLQECLESSNLFAGVGLVQAIRSRESVLMQLADVLLGAASARLNRSFQHGTAKCEVIRRIESRLGRMISATPKNEEKFNVFAIQLRGGW